MDTLEIIVQGYAYPGKSDSFYHASPSSVLIESNGKRVLADPGADKDKLLAGLDALGLTTSDIDIVFLTHWHPDHFLNIRLFPDHDIYDATTIWRDNGEEEFPNPKDDFVMDKIPGTDIEILSTPGHREEHVSLLVNTADRGVVCVAQDVFWWEDGKQPEQTTEEDLMNLEDPFLADSDALMTSRKKVLKVADWIIPGHGKIFKNPSK